MTHPFERLPAASRLRVFTLLLVANVTLLAALLAMGGMLGGGIAALLTGDRAARVVAGWSANGRILLAWASLLVDCLFVPLYTSLVALACVWSASLHSARPRVRRMGIWVAWLQWGGGLADLVENALLALLLYRLRRAEPSGALTGVLSVATGVKWSLFGAGVVYALLASRFFTYFAALRPSFFFGLLIAGLPLTAIPGAPLGSMLGNLFADYHRFSEAFLFGAAVFGAAWALMLTAGLSLDLERERATVVVPVPDRETPPRRRLLTIPLKSRWVFILFTLLAVPGTVAVIASSKDWPSVTAYLLFGALVLYAGIDLTISVLSFGDPELRILPWEPGFHRLAGRLFSDATLHRLGWPERKLAELLAKAARGARLPAFFFLRRDRSQALNGDQVFAVATAVFVFAVYLFLYYSFLPDGWLHSSLDRLPPAGILYLLLISLIMVVSPLWLFLHGYRMALYAFVAWILLVNWVQSSGPVEGSWWRGNPVHTYDVHRLAAADDEVAGSEVLAPLARGPRASDGRRTLIVATASGGGILAAGWTTEVLGGLHRAYPLFRRELRLISAVSGGSVGTVHYVRRLHGGGEELPPLPTFVLQKIVSDSVETSLAATAFGFTFPDFHRLFLPFGVPEADRARLQEERWRNVAGPAPGAKPGEDERMSRWSADIRSGVKPAVILNATVLETGERIAITPLASLQQMDPAKLAPDWGGWRPSDDEDLVPSRRNGARTLSEFLLAEKRAEELKREHGVEIFGYTLDAWTAARLSATFSYVSPPARARLVCGPLDQFCTQKELSTLFASFHLIDGGYHENFGLASALDWLTRAIRWCNANGGCPFDRVALVEIRAKPVTKVGEAAEEWLAAWLGPTVGLLNSWGYAQTSANDTSVDQLIRHMGEWNIPVESFVFVPEMRGTAPPGPDSACRTRGCCPGCPAGSDDYPLSWHLSERQKQAIHEYWLDPLNQCTLRAFLRFVQCGDTERPCPAAEKELGNCCEQPFEGVPP